MKETTIFELPESAFFQKDEIAYWMVQAYDSFEIQEPSPAAFPHKKEDTLRSHEEETASQNNLFVRVDEDTMGLGNYGHLDQFPSPFSIEKGLPFGKTRSPRPLYFWLAIILAVLTVLIAAFLLGKKNNNFASRISAILPFKKVEMSKLQFSDLNSYRLDRDKGKGPVFVVEGKVTNHYEKTCHRIQVKGILFDERDKIIMEEQVYCGNILSKKEIKSLSKENMARKLKNIGGSTAANRDIASGDSIPFMLIFFTPPKSEFEFSLEVTQYSFTAPKG